MKCAMCGADHPMNEIIFKEDGKVPGLIMPAYRALCPDCSRKVPIDDTTLARREDDGAPF